MAFDKETCQKHLKIWLAADEAIAKGQSYTIGNRSLTRINSREINKNIELWSSRLAQANRRSTGQRTYTVIPRG